jgi:ketosteroid isomerase-like protein
MTGEHPNAARARELFEAFAAGDADALRSGLAQDVVWRIGGRSAIAGEYRGQAALFAQMSRWRELTGGTYRASFASAVADDARLVAFYRATGTRDVRTIDLDQLLVVTVDEGRRWKRVLALPTDQYAFDAFWS